MASLMINGLRGNSASKSGFSGMRRALKLRAQHDLCDCTSLVICVQPEVLQSVTILIKVPLAGIVATHSREKRGASALAPDGTRGATSRARDWTGLPLRT